MKIPGPFLLVKIVWCLHLTAVFLCPLQAQNLPYERLSSELGLSQNMITCLMQDDRGFLWVGTKDGLNRFDGYRFKVYRHDPFDSTSISNNYVNHILQDNQGRIWVTTFKGLNLFDPAKEAFQHISPDTTAHDGLASEKTLLMFLDQKGRIWLNTDDFSLYLLEMPPTSTNVKDLKIRRISRMRNESDSLIQVQAGKIIQDKKGTYWINSPSGLFRFREEGEAHSFSISRQFPETLDPSWRKTLEEMDDVDGHYFRIAEGRNGGVWLGWGERIAYWDPESASWRQYPIVPNYFIVEANFWDGAFEWLEDSKGKVWVTFINGVLEFDPVSGLSTWYSSENNPKHPLHAGAAPILEDEGGLIWVGSKGHGLLKLNRNAKRFEGKRNDKLHKFLYKGESMRAICKTDDGQIWFSPSTEGLYRYDPEKRQIKRVYLLEDTKNIGLVFTIQEDASGVLWLGGSEGLIKLIREKNNEIRISRTYHPFPELDKPKVRYIWKIIEGQDGALWMVSSTNLCRFDPVSEQFTYYPYLPERNLTILNNEFPTLFQDINGIFWIGCSEGLLRFDPDSATFRHYENNPSNPSSLSQNLVKSIAADPVAPGHFLWIGTGGGGLVRFDQDKETFESYTEKDGLPDMVVYGILPDLSGNLWMSTNKGLSVFQPETRTFRNFDEKDGLQNLEFNSGSYFMGADGQLFFGGIEGFNGFYPGEMLKMNLHVPKVVFTGFRISNKPVSMKEPFSILNKDISYCEKLELNHNIKIISFEFAALDFSDPSQNQFACKMEGFDQDWQYLGPVHSATYTNLDAGTYTFRVKASNNDGVWNEEGASIQIVVRSPWWASWWAITLYGIAIAGILGAFLRLQDKRNQDKAEANRLKMLNEAKSTFLSTVSHELRTPLTSIMGFSKIIKKRMTDRLLPKLDLKDPQIARAANQVMANLDIVVSESERLTSLINQVLDLAKIEAGKVEWHDELVEVAEILERASAATASIFTEKRLALVQKIDKELPPVYGDKDRLIQVMINLLSNAVKFTDKGRIKCSAQRQGEMVIVRVEDTGMGISERDIHQIFEKFKQIGDDTLTNKPQGTGLGLPICKEIVERHGGKIWVESIPGEGSTFVFTLPVQRD